MSFFPAAVLFAVLAGSAPAADMNERDIPAGWDLSATLALFRNLPIIIDKQSIPATEGDVHFAKDSKYSEDGGQVFTNTYDFYRKTTDGKYLKVSVVEEHRMAEVTATQSTTEAQPFHRVADLSQTASVVGSLPGGTSVRQPLSRLLCYIFDHHKTLAASKAGEMARKLNYKAAGRFRPADYKQPRVSYLEEGGDQVAKVRIYGLDTLMSQRQSLIYQGDAMEDKVLEIAVDSSGNALVTMDTLKR